MRENCELIELNEHVTDAEITWAISYLDPEGVPADQYRYMCFSSAFCRSCCVVIGVGNDSAPSGMTP